MLKLNEINATSSVINQIKAWRKLLWSNSNFRFTPLTLYGTEVTKSISPNILVKLQA